MKIRAKRRPVSSLRMKSRSRKRKAADIEKQLGELREKKTELENLEIINTVRAMVMDKDQIMAFLSNMKGGSSSKQPKIESMDVTENE